MTAGEIERLRRLCEKATAADPGKLLEYCPAHDYGDPGYPPSECPHCVHERDAARMELARLAAKAIPDLLDEVERLRGALEFYADREVWMVHTLVNADGQARNSEPIGEDRGKVARTALGVK